MNPTVERFFTAQAETSSGAGCGSRAIGGGVIVGQSGRAPRLHLAANTIFGRTCRRAPGRRLRWFPIRSQDSCEADHCEWARSSLFH
jgi:hypothetical protein